MRDLFTHRYRPTKDDFDSLWSHGVLAFDASSILTLYQLSSATQQQYFDVLTNFRDRIWIPFQAADEYQRRRPNLLLEIARKYQDVEKRLEELEVTLTSESRIPFIPVALQGEFVAVCKRVKEELVAEKSRLERDVEQDSVRARLDAIVGPSVGPALTKNQLEQIAADGPARYSRKTPPGWCDKDKGANPFGDLIIWHELIEKARSSGRDLIFVTDDEKEDWWHIVESKTLGPHPELRREFLELTGKQYYSYKTTSFLSYAGERLGHPIDPKVIKEVDRVIASTVKERSLQKELVLEPLRRLAWNSRSSEEASAALAELERLRQVLPETMSVASDDVLPNRALAIAEIKSVLREAHFDGPGAETRFYSSIGLGHESELDDMPLDRLQKVANEARSLLPAWNKQALDSPDGMMLQGRVGG